MKKLSLAISCSLMAFLGISCANTYKTDLCQGRLDSAKAEYEILKQEYSDILMESNKTGHMNNKFWSLKAEIPSGPQNRK